MLLLGEAVSIRLEIKQQNTCAGSGWGEGVLKGLNKYSCHLRTGFG